MALPSSGCLLLQLSKFPVLMNTQISFNIECDLNQSCLNHMWRGTSAVGRLTLCNMPKITIDVSETKL